MESALPDFVRRLGDAVSGKLGRPSHCRKVKNQEEWYINDPVFSFVQQGMKRGNTGYRVGYRYTKAEDSVWFTLVHSPTMASLFKRNLAMSTLTEILNKTSNYRESQYMYWSSRLAANKGLDKASMYHSAASMPQFIEELGAFDLVSDLFPPRPNTGKGDGKAPHAGNTFYLKLADSAASLGTSSAIDRFVDLTWPLFLCLYPVKPIERRTAALARKMLAKKIPRVCEFVSLHIPEIAGISPLCRGEVQGAHIKPDALGGSDLPENGVWLCEYHHRMTEGKLSGSRDNGLLNVDFVVKP